MPSRGKTRPRNTAVSSKRRFAVGANVVVKIPGVTGIVTQVDDQPTVLWEYWHTIQTELGERKEPGCNLELVQRPMTNAEARPTAMTQNFHLHGDNPRINVNSTDNSTNIASASYGLLFVQMREKASAIADETERKDIVARVDELEKARGSTGFLAAYQNFMASAADHMTVFGPFLPALAQMLPHIK
jgi:hypothetical protein